MRVLIGVLLLVGACSSAEKEDKERECEQIAGSIRDYAKGKGQPTAGACTNPAMPELKNACASLERCNREAKDL
jgi:hypothetical protein